MTNKYFTTTIKVEIAAAKQHLGAYADGDALFDWQPFNVPKGANKLTNIIALIRGTDGAAQSFAINYYFAKSINKTAPSSIGTLHGTASGVGFQNNLIGNCQMEELELVFGAGLDIMSIGPSHNGSSFPSPPSLVLQGEPESGSNVGYDKLYIAGTTPDGEPNFSTGVITSGAVDVSELSAAQLVNADIEGTDPRNVFAPGDIIHAEDGIILGEIESMADANTITFKTDGSVQRHAGGETLFTNQNSLANWKTQNGADAAGDLASGDELYNLHPITLILSWER